MFDDSGFIFGIIIIVFVTIYVWEIFDGNEYNAGYEEALVNCRIGVDLFSTSVREEASFATATETEIFYEIVELLDSFCEDLEDQYQKYIK